jgi:hypothetical protein
VAGPCHASDFGSARPEQSILKRHPAFLSLAAIQAFCLTKAHHGTRCSGAEAKPLLSSTRLIRELYELIEALDRRVPQGHRPGEPTIARDSAALRIETLTRIAELEGARAGD